METAIAAHQDLNHEEIAARAYQIWESSGRPPGSELKNWLQAEMELASAKPANQGERPERTHKPASPASSRPTANPEQGRTPSRSPRQLTAAA
jgi:hypothetical protein